MTLPKIKFQSAAGKVTIPQTGKVIELDAADIKLPSGSAAATLAVPGKEFIWTASELDSRTTGGADIYSMYLTSDGSAVVILERIGGSGNPNGLRIIVLDTASGKIIRASKTLDIKLHFAVLCGIDKLIAAVSDPDDADGKIRLAKIDIINESVEKSDIIAYSPCYFAVRENFIYICIPKEKTVQAYDTADFTNVASCTFQNTSAAGIALSQNAGQIAVFGGNTVEIFDANIHNNTLYAKGKYSVPDADFTHSAAIKDDIFVFYCTGKPAYLLMNRQLIMLDVKCGEISAVHPTTGTLALENRMREFEVFRFPALKPLHKYAPRKMRPLSRNDNTFLFFLPGKNADKLILADHRGNIWKIELSGKRGKKFPIYTTSDFKR